MLLYLLPRPVRLLSPAGYLVSDVVSRVKILTGQVNSPILNFPFFVKDGEREARNDRRG